MASVHITERATTQGHPRYVVRYRTGGRGAPLVHAGSFKRLTDAERRRDEIAEKIAAGQQPPRTVRTHAVTRTVVASVYIARAENGAALYVGITGRNLRRFHEHARSSAWWPKAASLDLEHLKTRAEAEERERELIAELQPPFNVIHVIAGVA